MTAAERSRRYRERKKQERVRRVGEKTFSCVKDFNEWFGNQKTKLELFYSRRDGPRRLGSSVTYYKCKSELVDENKVQFDYGFVENAHISERQNSNEALSGENFKYADDAIEGLKRNDPSIVLCTAIGNCSSNHFGSNDSNDDANELHKAIAYIPECGVTNRWHVKNRRTSVRCPAFLTIRHRRDGSVLIKGCNVLHAESCQSYAFEATTKTMTDSRCRYVPTSDLAPDVYYRGQRNGHVEIGASQFPVEQTNSGVLGDDCMNINTMEMNGAIDQMGNYVNVQNDDVEPHTSRAYFPVHDSNPVCNPDEKDLKTSINDSCVCPMSSPLSQCSVSVSPSLSSSSVPNSSASLRFSNSSAFLTSLSSFSPSVSPNVPCISTPPLNIVPIISLNSYSSPCTHDSTTLLPRCTSRVPLSSSVPRSFALHPTCLLAEDSSEHQRTAHDDGVTSNMQHLLKAQCFQNPLLSSVSTSHYSYDSASSAALHSALSASTSYENNACNGDTKDSFPYGNINTEALSCCDDPNALCTPRNVSDNESTDDSCGNNCNHRVDGSYAQCECIRSASGMNASVTCNNCSNTYNGRSNMDRAAGAIDVAKMREVVRNVPADSVLTAPLATNTAAAAGTTDVESSVARKNPDGEHWKGLMPAEDVDIRFFAPFSRGDETQAIVPFTLGCVESRNMHLQVCDNGGCMRGVEVIDQENQYREQLHHQQLRQYHSQCEQWRN